MTRAATLSLFTTVCYRDGCTKVSGFRLDPDGRWYCTLPDGLAPIFGKQTVCANAPDGWVEKDGHLYCSATCAAEAV